MTAAATPGLAAVPTHRVGLGVGGTKIHGVLLDGDAVVAEVRVPVQRGAAGVVDAAADAVGALLDSAVPDRPAGLAGVGLGMPGVVTPEDGTVAHAVNLGIGDPVALGPRLAGRLGVPVRHENDLTVAALGAARVMGLAGDLAFLAVGTGLAAGLLLDGRVHRGHRGGAGEIGHLVNDASGPSCACGRRGLLELFDSGRAMDDAW